MNEKKDKNPKSRNVCPKLETIAGHQTTGNGTCDCEWIFVAVTGVITVALGMGMAGDLQGSQKDIEKHWIPSCSEAMRTGWGMKLSGRTMQQQL